MFENNFKNLLVSALGMSAAIFMFLMIVIVKVSPGNAEIMFGETKVMSPMEGSVVEWKVAVGDKVK